MPHTRCTKGKRVRIVLHSGEEIIGKFFERTGKFVVLEGNVRIAGRNIRSFGLYREHEPQK